MNGRNMAAYRATWARSLQYPEDFWLEAAQAIEWTVAPRRALEAIGERWAWFPEGELNMSTNALDRHIDAGRGNAIALRYDSAMLATKASYTYRELRDEVAVFAGALRDLGVGVGDRVLL